MEMTRRGFGSLVGRLGVGAVAAGLLGACGDDNGGGGTSHATIQLSWLKDASFAGTYIANSRGWFEDEGLDVSLRPGGPNVVVPPVVAAGTALVGMASTDVTAAARANGTKLKIIGARFQRNPFCIISLAGLPLRSPEDLAGKKIGVSPTNTLAFKSYLAINDVPENSVRQVPIQFDATPLTNGDVDGIMGYYTSQPNDMRASGLEPVTMLFSDFGFTLYENVYIVKDDSLDAHRDRIEGFMRAERRGWRANLDDPDLGIRTTMKDAGGSDTGLDESVQRLINTSQIELITPGDGHVLLGMDDEGIAANLSLLRDRLGIDAPDELFDTSVLDAIAAKA